MKKLSVILIAALLVSLLTFGAGADDLNLTTEMLIDMSEVASITDVMETSQVTDRVTEGELDGEKAFVFNVGELMGLPGENTVGGRFLWKKLLNKTVNFDDWEYVGVRMKIEGYGRLIGEMFGNTDTEEAAGARAGIFTIHTIFVDMDGNIENEIMGYYEPEVYDFDGWVYFSLTEGVWQGGQTVERELGESLIERNPCPEPYCHWEVNSTDVEWSGVYIYDGEDLTITVGDVVLAREELIEDDPTEAPADPTEAPADPTEAPADPTEAPTDEPSDAPAADLTRLWIAIAAALVIAAVILAVVLGKKKK